MTRDNLSDELDGLVPTTPEASGWGPKVRTEHRRRRVRTSGAVAGAAAALLVAVAVGGTVQQLRPEQYATPASPTPTLSTVSGHLLAARGTLLDTGTGMTICNGLVLLSRPPSCMHATSIVGISWEDVPWAENEAGITFTEDTIIVGTFEGGVFAATQVFRADDPAAPQPPETTSREALPTLCDVPTRGTGPSSYEVLAAAASALPGYQAVWVSPNQVTWNVAVSEDVEDARSALGKVFGGELCVGTIEGPTDKALKVAQQALKPLMPDVTTTRTTAGAVWSASSSVSGLGNRLEVDVARDTPELLDQIESAVGPDVWAYTNVIPFFYPVFGTATADPTQEVPAHTDSASGAPIPPPTIGSSNPSEPVGTAACELDPDGRMTTTDLPNNTLPDGPAAVWLCDGTGTPAAPLVGKQAMQQVIDTFRALPTSSPLDDATWPMRSHDYVLVDYPDGQRYVIEVDTNSFEVRWGMGRQHIRSGGGEWFTKLKQLWVEQRNKTPQDPPLKPVGDVCGDVHSNLQRTIDYYDAAGFLCNTDPSTGEQHSATLALERALVQSIGKAALETSTPWPDAKMLVWTGEVIVLVDDYGERLRMLHTADDTWLWTDSTGQWEWTPSPLLREQIPVAAVKDAPLPEPTNS